MRLLLIIIGVLSIMGCQRGCTFHSHKTLDRAEELRKVGNLTIKLIAEHIQHKSTTISKKTANPIQTVSDFNDYKVEQSDADYSLELKMELGGEYYTLANQGATKQDQQLEEALKAVVIQHSSDFHYLAVAHKEVAVLLLQRMGQDYAASPYFVRLSHSAKGGIDFSKLPTEAQFVDDVLMERERMIEGDWLDRRDSALLLYLQQQPWTELQCKTLWEGRLKSDFSWAVLSPQKVAEMGKKYPGWQKKALKEAADYVANESGYIDKKNGKHVELFFALAAPSDLQAMDRKLAAKWGKTFEDMAEVYFLKRMSRQERAPIDAKARTTIDRLAEQAHKAYKADPSRVSDKTKAAFRWLVATKNHALLESFLKTLLQQMQPESDALELVQGSYADLTPSMQQQVLAQQQQLFLSSKKSDKEKPFFTAARILPIYRFLDGKLACGELQKLREHYRSEFPTEETVLPKTQACGF